jgi:alkanesulfonate monooxygenase SsuD/methylene tetrahydromethanopterin reductase-like flavin-dependent oxidoreductase (luciferase family)
MRVSTVILPYRRWAQARGTWERAEDLGFHAAYTYDHLSWRSFRDGPWFDAVTTLAAAAVTTSTIRIGTLVTTPNFRHPVPLARALLGLDDLARGRLVVGVGSGGTGYDAGALGGPTWTPAERGARFADFVTLLDRLLTQPVTTEDGPYYAAREVVRHPSPVAAPRPPFVVSALGPRAMAVAAEFGQAWVTTGVLPGSDDVPAEAAVGSQARALDEVLAARGRDPGSLGRVLLDGFSQERPLSSVDAFVDWAGRYGALGIGELVVHWPVPDSPFAADPVVFERIATDGVAQLDR